MTLVTDRPGNPLTAAVQITADVAKVPLFTKVGSADQIKEMQKKTAGMPLPILQVDKDTLVSQAGAITNFIARSSKSDDVTKSLVGRTAFEQAKIDQVLSTVACDVIAKTKVIEAALFGADKSVKDLPQRLTDLKAVIKRFNDQLGDSEWLVGGRMTVADIMLFCSIATVFQIGIDGGFRKAIPSLAKWFDKISSLPVVTRRLGNIKACEKAIAAPKK